MTPPCNHLIITQLMPYLNVHLRVTYCISCGEVFGDVVVAEVQA